MYPSPGQGRGGMYAQVPPPRDQYEGQARDLSRLTSRETSSALLSDRSRGTPRDPRDPAARSASARRNAEELEKMRKDFFQYLSETSDESKDFMKRYWSIACRFQASIAQEKDESKLKCLFKRGKHAPRGDEDKAALVNDFMNECERWQHRFRKLVVDGKAMLKTIDGWRELAGRKAEFVNVQYWFNSTLIDGTRCVPMLDYVMEPDPLNEAKASILNHWVKELYLRRLHAYWFLMNPERVHRVILFLGAESLRFMKCLSVHITSGHIIKFEGLFDRVSNRRYQFKGRDVEVAEAMFDAISKDLGEHDDDNEEKVWNMLAPKKPDEQRGFFERFFLPTPPKVEIEFYWCGVKGMLTHKKIEVISALSVCDESSGVFRPVVSRALFRHHWSHCYELFCLDRALDTISLLCLLYVVYQSKLSETPHVDLHGQPTNDPAVSRVSMQAMMWVVAGINIIMLVQIVFEGMMAACQRNRSWFTAYNLFLVFVELVSLVVLWELNGILPRDSLDSLYESLGLVQDAKNVNVTDSVDPLNNTASSLPSSFRDVLAHKPIMFMSLILFKWTQFLFGFLVFDIGKTVLPAVYAMKSGESVKFVIYMTMVIFACTHAYWSLPLEMGDYEISGKFGSLATSFFRMFRLCVMGDFDIWELEGIDGVMDEDGYVDESVTDWNMSMNGTTGIWDIPGKALHYHQDLRWTVLGFGLILTIMLMNMYIGVLSLAYEQFLAIQLEVFSHAKSKFMVRYLLRRHAFRNFTKFRCLKRHQVHHDEMSAEQQRAEENFQQKLKGYLEEALSRHTDPTTIEDIPDIHPQFKEELLVDKIHWQGFWATVPQDLVTPEETTVQFQRMEDTQETLGERLDIMDGNLDTIDEMLDRMLGVAVQRVVAGQAP